MISNLALESAEKLSLTSIRNIEEIKKKNNVLCNAEKFVNLYDDKYHLHSLDYAFLIKDLSLLKEFFPFTSFSFDFSTSNNAHRSFDQIMQTLKDTTDKISEKNLIYRCILEGKINIISSFFNRNRYTFDLYPPHGLSCMHFAAMGNSSEIIQLLKEHFVPVDSADEWGRTPLHYAAVNSNKELLPFLVENVNTLFQKDYLGVSPIDLLNYQAATKDPIKTTPYDLLNASLLFSSAILEIISTISTSETLQNIKPFVNYLTLTSQVTYLLKNRLHSLTQTFLSVAFYLLSQQFTVFRLAMNAYFLSKAAFQTLNQITTIRHFYHSRPYDSLKKLVVYSIELSSFSAQLLTHFPPSFFKENFNDLKSISGFHFSKIGKQSFAEWEKFSKFTQVCFDNLERILNTYFG